MGFVQSSFAFAFTILHILASAVGRIISTRLKIKKFLGQHLVSSFDLHFCSAENCSMLPIVSNIYSDSDVMVISAQFCSNSQGSMQWPSEG